MSLILEALKKSEAKRRLGEAPDIGTPFATPRRRSRGLPLLVFAIVAAGAFGWWLLRYPSAGTSATSGSPQKTAATAPATNAKSAPAAPGPTQRPPPTQRPQPTQNAQAAQQVKAAAAEPAAPSVPADASQWVAVGKSDNNRRGAAAGMRKLPANMHRIEPATAVADKSPGGAREKKAAAEQPARGTAPPSTPLLAKAEKAPDVRAVISAEPPPAPKTAAPTPAAEPSTSAATATAKQDVPFYYELPFNVRKTLPPLRLSMHVYAGDPGQRFVVLNDSRLGEGDKTADDVMLREVRKDGAVLEFQGQRFFYPRDGF